jgi:hypothetical protein
LAKSALSQSILGNEEKSHDICHSDTDNAPLEFKSQHFLLFLKTARLKKIPLADGHVKVEGLDVKIQLGFGVEPEPADVAGAVAVVGVKIDHLGGHSRIFFRNESIETSYKTDGLTVCEERFYSRIFKSTFN